MTDKEKLKQVLEAIRIMKSDSNKINGVTLRAICAELIINIQDHINEGN